MHSSCHRHTPNLSLFVDGLSHKAFVVLVIFHMGLTVL